jgi:hypothetical protein
VNKPERGTSLSATLDRLLIELIQLLFFCAVPWLVGAWIIPFPKQQQWIVTTVLFPRFFE